MSSSNEVGGLTLNWTIENFELILEEAKHAVFVAPLFKAFNTEDSWSQLAINCSDSELHFHFFCFKESWIFEPCGMTLISSSGEYELQTRSVPDFHHYIERNIIERIFANDRQSNLPNSALTLRYKVHQKAMKAREFHIHSVLQRVNFRLDLEQLFSWRTQFFEIYNILFYMDMDIVTKDGRRTAIVQFEGQTGIESLPTFVYCEFTSQKGNIIRYYNSMRTRCSLNFEILEEDMANFNLQVNCIVAINKSCSHKQEHLSSIGKDLLCLYREALHSDATLKADGKSFPVHKCILSTRSEVFRAMFEKDRMSEGREGVVGIDDADSKTVDRMLVYLYGDSLEDLQCEEAVALYYLADKYAVHLLKQKCADVLKTGLTTDNVCNLLVLANAHSDEQLTERVVDFLSDHQEVMSSSEWGKLEDSHPRLTTKILREILFKKK